MIPMVWITWLEILRKRVLLVTVLMTVAFLGLYAFAMHALIAPNTSAGETNLLDAYLHGVLVLSMGLYVSNFTVAYLAIFSSAGTISAEIENGLLLAILPRPISRWQVYLGKWMGYSVWSLAYGALMFWLIVWIAHIFLPTPESGAMLWKAFGVFELIPLILVSLSLLGSMYLPTLGNGVAVTLLFGIGLIGGFIQRISPAGGLPALDKIGLVTSLVIPTNAIYYRVMSEFLGGGNSPIGGQDVNNILGPFGGGPTPNNIFLVYTALYILAVTVFGMRKFTKKDI